jgi:hypothetical protein
MMVAPPKNEHIDMLFDSGADELGMNLEFWSDDAWKEYIPGKHREIGKRRYLEALDYAVKIFGPTKTRSVFVVGLEKMKHTIDGASYVASRGVMPILSPFRPLNGTLLENIGDFRVDDYLEAYTQITDRIESFDIPLGPTCICCQNNTLAMPMGRHYQMY